MAAPKSSQTARRYILTASFAAITATGAWYGAGLKTQQELKQEHKAIMEATPEEKIAQLESRRAKLEAYRGEIETKILRLTAGSTDAASQETQDLSG